MKKIALLTLLLINLSLSFSLPRNQASPAIFSVTQSAGTILFRHTDSTQTIIPCQSVASIVSNADPSKIVSVWVVQQGDYDKIMQFDYSVCGFSTKQEAVDSVTVWASCVYVSDSAYTTILYTNTDSATITSYDVLNSQNAPPGRPATGDTYLVGTSPSGAWVGHAKDIAEWNGSAWVFTDGVQGDFLYNATNALTYIFRLGNWVQTTGIPALNNGNTISSGLKIGTNNSRSLTFETNNINRGRFDSVGRFYVYDTSLRKSNKYLQIDSITGRLVASDISGGGGGGIESIVAGTNITVDDTDPQNPIISATGGGSPAGSNNQIQINQSGAFFADSTFQKSDADFNVGLNHTQQSAVTFTGSGLDDLTVAGTFSGTYPTTYTVTIDGNNQDFIAVDTSSITGGTFAISDVITNGTGGTATILSVNAVTLPSSATLLRVNVSAGTFNPGDTIDNGSGVTATTLSPVIVKDTYTWTDGTTTENNVYLVNPNGLILFLDGGTGYTIGDSWTWDYTSVNQNVLDFSNNDYKFQSVLGTDTFGYQIGDNLLGHGLKGAVNTYTNTGGDFGLLGFTSLRGLLGSTNQLYFSGGERASTYLAKNQYNIEVGNGTDKFLQSITPVTFSYINIIGGIEYGIEQSAGVVTIGNGTGGGNNTKITIDDVNEQITISNLSAYDDDTAAGVGGLTAGMVYMTTGLGSAPLNAAGILMIKQ